MRYTKLVVGVVCVTSVAALAGPAEGARWKGTTSQGRTVKVETGADGLVTAFRIRWLARCRRGTRLRAPTVFTRPIDRLEPAAFEDGGTYRFRIRGGYRVTDTAFAQGRLTAGNVWRGTFHNRSVVRRNGRVVTRCRIKRIRWSASPVG
jgi:hypothetical protein